MVIVKEVDAEVADKIDTALVKSRLPDLPGTGIIFVCRSEGGAEDEWTDENGIRYIVIQLPYEAVRQSEDVTGLMLTKARKRLGIGDGAPPDEEGG